jgi:hypothetical protein
MTRPWNRSWIRLLATVLPLLIVAPLHAQSPTTGLLTGVVVDGLGEPLDGVFVTAVESGTGLSREAFSDRNGEFRFAFLPPGEYILSLEKLGFAPKRITGVPVRTGRGVSLEAVLAVSVADAVEEVRFAGAGVSLGRVGGSQWIPEFGTRWLPGQRRSVAELGRLTSAATDDLTVEGLPAWLSVLAMDGVPFRPVSHPYVRPAPLRSIAFPITGAGMAQLVTNGLDVEWGGAAGAFLSVHNRRGTATAALDAHGSWSGSPLPGPSFAVSGGSTGTDLQGGASVRAPVLGNRARISAGVELTRLQLASAPAWPSTDAAVALAEHADASGVAARAYQQPGTVPFEAVAGFARLDGAVGGRHQVAAWLNVATMPRIAGVDPVSRTLPELDGADALGGVTLLSNLGTVDNDLRAAFTLSTRNTAALAAVAPTLLAGDALALGGPRQAAAADEMRLLLSDAVHYRVGRHALKFGAGLAISSYSFDYRPGADGEYRFGGVAQLLARTGVRTIMEGGAPGADWTTLVPSVFVQDRWELGQGFELLAGARAEREALPSDRVTEDAEWLRLSGVSNRPADRTAWRGAVRAGLTWDVQRSHEWIAHVGGGIFHDRVDPLLLSQWQTDAGTARVVRQVGNVDWPQPAGGGFGLRRLTVLAPGFEAPRTARASGGVVRRIDEHSSLHVSGVVRRTERLPRRSDLNLLPLPAARDQYARPIYGTLLKQGGLLVAEHGTGRRFETYDEVAGITADAWSSHWGVTVGFERDAAGGPGVVARYTFGRTTDNWFDARQGGWTAAAPQGFEGAVEWAEGTSDFDIPHRAVAGVILAGPFGARAALLYRLQSGLPFTPGFRAGVDASGDGYGGNDPAFVDPALPGMQELSAAWPCLRESSGRFAARNACRADMTHALDVSLGVQLVRIGRGAASLFVDALDLLEAERGMPDAALYLVDPAGSLGTDADARTVTVPLLVNPDFGQPLAAPTTGRRFRLGLSLNW